MFRYLTISFASMSLIISQLIVGTGLAVSSLFLSATPAFAVCTTAPPGGGINAGSINIGEGVRFNGYVCRSGSWVRESTGGPSPSRPTCESGTETRTNSDGSVTTTTITYDSNCNVISRRTSTTKSTTTETSSSSSDSAGGAVAALAVVGLGVWAFSGGDENSFISFKPMEAAGPIYGQARQWIGVEHDVSQNVKVSLGSFWFVSDDVASILPSAENIGSELVFALGDRKSAKGELALTASAFFNDQSANLDDSLRVATDRFGVWDERVALTYRKAF